ncbi:MAG: TSUP family transporter [Algicola sp.]|nr:TSUP family transporter [Algicola sp.]
MEASVDLLALLFLVSLVAGFVDSITGGGGLISLPVLMMAGLSPAQALGTNKLQGMFGKLSSVRYFWQHNMLDLFAMKWLILVSFFGAMLGAVVILRVDSQFLEHFMPWCIGALVLYLVFSPRIGDIDRRQRITLGLFTVVVVSTLAFYDGFFGPASGSFFAIVFVALLGYNLTKATAQTKVLLLVANVASLGVFISGGSVMWKIGLCMAIGQWIGAHYGSAMVFDKGSKIIKPMLVSVCTLVICKMLWFGHA